MKHHHFEKYCPGRRGTSLKAVLWSGTVAALIIGIVQALRSCRKCEYCRKIRLCGVCRCESPETSSESV